MTASQPQQNARRRRRSDASLSANASANCSLLIADMDASTATSASAHVTATAGRPNTSLAAQLCSLANSIAAKSDALLPLVRSAAATPADSWPDSIKPALQDLAKDVVQLTTVTKEQVRPILEAQQQQQRTAASAAFKKWSNQLKLSFKTLVKILTNPAGSPSPLTSPSADLPTSPTVAFSSSGDIPLQLVQQTADEMLQAIRLILVFCCGSQFTSKHAPLLNPDALAQIELDMYMQQQQHQHNHQPSTVRHVPSDATLASSLSSLSMSMGTAMDESGISSSASTFNPHTRNRNNNTSAETITPTASGSASAASIAVTENASAVNRLANNGHRVQADPEHMNADYEHYYRQYQDYYGQQYAPPLPEQMHQDPQYVYDLSYQLHLQQQQHQHQQFGYADPQAFYPVYSTHTAGSSSMAPVVTASAPVAQDAATSQAAFSPHQQQQHQQQQHQQQHQQYPAQGGHAAQASPFAGPPNTPNPTAQQAQPSPMPAEPITATQQQAVGAHRAVSSASTAVPSRPDSGMAKDMPAITDKNILFDLIIGSLYASVDRINTVSSSRQSDAALCSDMTAIQDLVQTAFVHASSLRSMLTADTQSTARTVQSLTADLQRANEQIEEHKSTINLLEEENRALETRGTELAGRSKEHRSRARELERRTRELDGWGSQLEERCQERDKHINDLVALVQSLEADHAALLCERDAFAAEASRVNREMFAQRETHDRDMKARQAEWETRSKALDAEAARLRTELAAAQSQIDMLKRNMDTLRETSDRDSRARVAEVDKRRLQAETRLAKVQSDHTATVKDMERMRTEMHELRQAHNQEIKARIADMDSRYKQVEASAAKLRTEHAAATQEIARLLKEVAVLQDHKCVVPHHPQPHAQHQQHQQHQQQQQQHIMPNLAKSQKEGILKRQGAADASRMHDMSVASVSFASTTASFSAMDASRLRGPRPPLPRVPEKVPAQPASGSTSGSTDAVSTASSSRPAPKLAAKASSTSLYLSASNNHGQQHGASDGTYSTTTLPIGSMSALGPALAAGDSSQLFELPSMMSEVSMNQSSLLDRSELIFRHSRQSLIINYRDLPLADIETVLDSVKRRAIILQRRRPIWSVRPMSGSGMAGKNPKLRRSALLSLAALVIQTHWRGYKARRLLNGTCTRFFVAAELIETEASYLQGLFTIITCALPVKDVLQAEPDSHGMLTRPDFNRILLSIEKVANTSATLLFLLAGRLQYWHVDQTIGDLFGLMAPHLKVYSVYVDRYADTLKYFSLPKAVMKMYTQDALHLHDLLITPIQRLSMYKLLVERMWSLTPDGHADRGHLANGRDSIDHTIRWIEGNERLDDEMQRLEEYLQNGPMSLGRDTSRLLTFLEGDDSMNQSFGETPHLERRSTIA